ncbi:putative precursor of head vertex subunit [Cronobacter phage S13]|uniref:Capsid vertex protein n=1 Tax=Cronobacter phage LPCS28 TaxID=2924885 RepID=A0AAE9K681_9CAUD|nr:putative precursor of head vertex subunit [Cronobacter phage S13]YP_010665930.1 major head protein [Cronobacter phage LPCS28]AIA64878.1 putative precursor of head vertex subunit [Cronobacter phage S13]UNY47119.1 hypothetical protein EHEKIMEA_00237 [Cronobacter phage LPCS28]
MSYKHIKQLIHESNQTGNVENGRPTLVSVTGKADNIIFTDLVATQVTKTPNASVYGLSVYNTGKKEDDSVKSDIYHDPGTSTGALGITQGYKLDEFDVSKAYEAGDQFKVESKGLFFEVTQNVTFSSLDGEDDYQKLMTGITLAKARVLTDAIPYGEDTREEIAGVDFTLRKWDLQIGARKLKVSISNELIEDMHFNSMDSDALIDDIVASSVAMDINKDIIQKLINVSNRFEDPFFVKNGIADLSGAGKSVTDKARELYALICLAGSRIYERTTYAATYVVCSPMVFSILTGSGWVKPFKSEEDDETLNSTLAGVMNNGMKIYVDRFPLFEYFVVGCKHEREGLESVGSLYYSPYTENDGAGFLTFVNPPSDFQPRIGVLVRYALSINNVYSNLTEEEREIVGADDWNKLMGKSEASQFVRVKF